MRPKRITAIGAVYDIKSRIDHNARALRNPKFKQGLLDFFLKAKLKFDFKLLKLCVMDNYIHLIIRPGQEESISRIMQWVKCNFAKWWNKQNNTKGHLWGERFYSRIIENVIDLEVVSKYIDKESVAGGWEKGAGRQKTGILLPILRGLVYVTDTILNLHEWFPLYANPH